MPAADDFLAANAAYAEAFCHRRLAAAPSRGVAVLTCMDARFDPAKALGLSEGDAHVIRNAGGVASEDALRSLVVSQHALGTREVVVVHHTDCGMATFTDDQLRDKVEQATGHRPGFAMWTFRDVEEDLRQTALAVAACPFLVVDGVRAFVYDVGTGRLRELDVPGA